MSLKKRAKPKASKAKPVRRRRRSKKRKTTAAPMDHALSFALNGEKPKYEPWEPLREGYGNNDDLGFGRPPTAEELKFQKVLASRYLRRR